jgi:predicted DNA-binding transcriptional regulator YafY
MNASKFFNRWYSIHQLIKQECTGGLRPFAKRIGISKSQLSIELEEMRLMGAPISFCASRKTYYYTNRCELRFGFYENKQV